MSPAALRCTHSASTSPGARALQLLSDVAGFEALDGRLQAKFDVRASGESERAVMSSLSGSVDARIQDGQILGINVPKMIRTLTARTLTGWQESRTESTDLSDLSASFRIEDGRATTSNLRLLGPLVRVNGSGTIDLAAKTLQFKLDPKLVASLEGQGGAADPLGFGVPVNVEGSWSDPRIYPDVAGILSDPDGAYAKLNALGQGLFGKGQGGGLDALMQGLGTMLGPRNDRRDDQDDRRDDRRPPAGAKPPDRPGRQRRGGRFPSRPVRPVTLHEDRMEDARRNWLRPSGLFGKYVVAFVGLVVFVLAVNVALETWSMYRETTVTVASAESEKAEATAHRIDQFLAEIERQISWVTRASVVTLEQRRADYMQLLQQAPAIDELVQLDGDGREQLRVSRFDVAVRRGADYSRDPRFAEAVARGSWWSPVSFRGDLPYVTVRHGPSRAQCRRHRRRAQPEIPLRFRHCARCRQARICLYRGTAGPPARELRRRTGGSGPISPACPRSPPWRSTAPSRPRSARIPAGIRCSSGPPRSRASICSCFSSSRSTRRSRRSTAS